MKVPSDNYAAVAVLPPVSGGRLQDAALRAWLSRADFRLEPGGAELLSRVAGAMGLPYPKAGLAALRMWGQTGERPAAWLAAADPVYLEPRLDRLCLHALRDNDVQPHELEALFDHLQSTLADEGYERFEAVHGAGYFYSNEKPATALVPPCVVDQLSPGDYLPSGRDAASHRNLLGEIEMALHENAVNQRRATAGKKPVNSLWLWGGGYAPECETRAQPPLFADDPLLLGYWQSKSALVQGWPGSIEKCIDAAGAVFVAVTPETGNGPDFLGDCLRQLHKAVRRKAVRRLTILFRDGCRADIRRANELRVWRRESRLLD